jgi:hypothetical protein
MCGVLSKCRKHGYVLSVIFMYRAKAADSAAHSKQLNPLVQKCSPALESYMCGVLSKCRKHGYVLSVISMYRVQAADSAAHSETTTLCYPISYTRTQQFSIHTR